MYLSLMTCCSRSPPWRVSLIAARKKLSPKQFSHSTGLFDYNASSLKPNSFTQKHFYTRSLHTEHLHRDAVTRKAIDTTHKRFYAQTLLHTEACTHRLFYPSIYLQRNTFTHRRLYRLTSSHRDFFFALYALCVASESCTPQRPIFHCWSLHHSNQSGCCTLEGYSRNITWRIFEILLFQGDRR